jgi:hypothetical protein
VTSALFGRGVSTTLSRADAGWGVVSSYLALPSEEADALTDLQGHSISYRIALESQRG